MIHGVGNLIEGGRFDLVILAEMGIRHERNLHSIVLLLDFYSCPSGDAILGILESSGQATALVSEEPTGCYRSAWAR